MRQAFAAVVLGVVASLAAAQNGGTYGGNPPAETGGAAIVYSKSGGGFMISAPGDWNIDREVGKRLGVCCVYYPKGTTWDTAETVMYLNLATKTRQTTLKEFMEQDLRSFREHDPEMTYEDVEDVPLQGKRVAKVRLYHNVNRASSEGWPTLTKKNSSRLSS